MTYRRPGVTVTQEFAAAAPALAALALPGVAVGPAYQIVDNDFIGTYEGGEQSYAYASLMPGAVVDISWPIENDPTPIIRKHISMVFQNTVLQILGEQLTGSTSATTLSDDTTGIFANVLAGDKIYILPKEDVEIVAAQTDGISADGTGQRHRLTSGVVSQFENVKIGDTVTITGGTNTITGTFSVISKVSSSTVALDGDINDGVGPATDVAYSITGSRGQGNSAPYTVRTVVSPNVIETTSPFAIAEFPVAYRIERKLSGNAPIARVESLPGAGFIADDGSIMLGDALTVSGFDVLSADVKVSYRALRTDMANAVVAYPTTVDIEAAFGGSNQLVPANELGFALLKMKENSTTPARGLGLSADYISNESLAYLKAADVLALSEVYAIAPLTRSQTIAQLLAQHVTQMSDPDKKKERVVIITSDLIKTMLMQAETTTSVSLVGSRVVVPQQIDGSGDILSNTVLNDATTNQFIDVVVGDSVTITGGTGVTPGIYTVASKQSVNQITLSSGFIVTGTPVDIAYYIVRQDGLVDGEYLYDRNATFLSTGVAPGHFVELSGSHTGRYKIATVLSDKELQLADTVLGAMGVSSGVTYKVVRDLTKTEQAEVISGYSASFANRRVVHLWSDIVQIPVGNEVHAVPSYFASAAIAALTEGLPSQQGFTNLLLSGFLGIFNSNGYFTDDQLNTIADGGTTILVQEGPGQPLLIRHQLTTDRSSVKFQEYSITKNVDFIAKFLRDTYKNPIGRYNIVDTTLDYLKTVAEAAIKFLRDGTRRQYIGGVIRSGTLATLEENADQLDTVDIEFDMSVPVPLNYINIKIRV